MQCSPVPYYLLVTKPKRPIDRLRWHAIALKWRQKKAWWWKAGFVILTVGWPIFATYLAVREVRRYGKVVRRETGRSVLSQFVDQWALALWFNVPPFAYYTYGLFRRERRGSALDYIHNPTLSSLAFSMNPDGNYRDLRDKVKFAKLCEEHSLPTIPILTIIQSGRVIDGHVTTAESLPETDLFAKPTDASLGRGVLAWKFIAPDHYQSNDGGNCTRQDIFDTLIQASHTWTYMLQPRIANHPDLANMTGGGLCTVRVMTGCRPTGEINVITAVLKMPRKGALADNFAAGGIACSVNLDNGRLGSAAGKEVAFQRFAQHPDTQQQIEGVMLPHWDRIKELCVRAHDQMAKFILVGWDVAVTDEGPLLVEGNYHPDMVLLQKGSDGPINDSSFVEIFLEHLEQNPTPSAAT